MSTDAVVLHETGFLSAGGRFGRHDLILDDAGAEWLLLAPPHRPGAPQKVMARHPDLDFALRLLVSACGMEESFRIDLPCGERILRPGRVPVGEVLAALDYAPVATLTAYARCLARRGAPAEEVSGALGARIADRPARVAEVEPMGDGDEDAWCCAVTLLHPGVFRRAEADAMVRGLLEGCGLELIGRGELDVGPGQPPANTAVVIPLWPLVHAA
jgi:hypothetical protein